MRNRRISWPAVLIVGLIGLFPLLEKPRFQAYHAVDVLQLIASGMCFGFAVGVLVAQRRSSSE